MTGVEAMPMLTMDPRDRFGGRGWPETLDPRDVDSPVRSGEVVVLTPPTALGSAARTKARMVMDDVWSRLTSGGSMNPPMTPDMFRRSDDMVRARLREDPFRKGRVPMKALALRADGTSLVVAGIVIDGDRMDDWKRARIRWAQMEATRRNREHDERREIKGVRESFFHDWLDGGDERPFTRIEWRNPEEALPDHGEIPEGGSEKVLVVVDRGDGPTVRSAKVGEGVDRPVVGFEDLDGGLARSLTFHVPHWRDGSHKLGADEIVAWAPMPGFPAVEGRP